MIPELLIITQVCMVLTGFYFSFLIKKRKKLDTKLTTKKIKRHLENYGYERLMR